MSLYRDSHTLITNEKIELRGLLIPHVSRIDLSNEEVESIEVVNLSIFKRFNLLGTQDMKTWWTFDLSRPFQKAGFVIRFKGGQYRLGFTVADFHNAYEVLLEEYGSRILDLRT